MVQAVNIYREDAEKLESGFNTVQCWEKNCNGTFKEHSGN